MYTQEQITKPFGTFIPAETLDQISVNKCIEEIELFPQVLNAFLDQLKPEHQEASYREGGWTFRQVTHHLADSHMNAYIRFKLGITENNPVIKPYSQQDWAETTDAKTMDAKVSASLLIPLHARWVTLLKSMAIEDFNRTYFHPEYKKEYTLAYVLGLYAWHGKHHYTQMFRHASNQGWI